MSCLDIIYQNIENKSPAYNAKSTM